MILTRVLRKKWVCLSLSLMLGTFVIGVVWAQVLNATGYAGCGIQSFDARGNSIRATFFHDGAIKNTRRRGGNVPISFLYGSALYPNQNLRDDNPHNDDFPFGQHNNRTDVDEASITAQQHSNWERDNFSAGAGETVTWYRWTEVWVDVDNPADWWIAGVTYSKYAGHQIKAVSEYDISTTPVNLQRSHYRKSTYWGNGEFGRYESWPH